MRYNFSGQREFLLNGIKINTLNRNTKIEKGKVIAQRQTNKTCSGQCDKSLRSPLIFHISLDTENA